MLKSERAAALIARAQDAEIIRDDCGGPCGLSAEQPLCPECAGAEEAALVEDRSILLDE